MSNGPPPPPPKAPSLIQQFTMDDSAPFDNDTTNPAESQSTDTTNVQQLTACDFEEFPLEVEEERENSPFGFGSGHHQSSSLGSSNGGGANKGRPLWNSASWEDDDSSQFGMQLRQEIARLSNAAK